MRQTLFIVEGQTEMVFVHKFISNLVALAALHVKLQKLHDGEIIEVGARGNPLPESTHVIHILNVEGDERVNSYIEDNLASFKRKGFQAVFGLRDRYTGSKARTKVNPAVIDLRTSELSRQTGLEIEITVAIEEIEAWFLAVPDFFLSYNDKLTLAHINKITGEDFRKCDVETLVHPAQFIDDILKSVGLRYRKRLDDSHKIAESLDYESLYLEKSGAMASLGRFTRQISSALP